MDFVPAAEMAQGSGHSSGLAPARRPVVFKTEGPGGKAEGKVEGIAAMLSRFGVNSTDSFRAKMGCEPNSDELAAVGMVASGSLLVA